MKARLSMSGRESTNPSDWIARADQDLGSAKFLFERPDEFPSAIADHCHQAVEKYLKAFLISKVGNHPKIHSLTTLLHLCEERDETLHSIHAECELLDPLYIEDRYPFEYLSDLTNEELTSFIKAAETVRNAVVSRIR